MKYVIWYTKETIYEDIFYSHLAPTLEQYNLDYEIYPMPNYKKWSMNVCQKPRAILQALEDLKQPIVVLDVDCKITGEPVLFERIKESDFDIACHYLDWKTWYNRPSETRKELLTGTLWFNYNPETIKLCKAWDDVCWRNKCADQIPLERLLETKFQHIRICKLPLDYVYINSLPNGNPPFVKINNPVITHFQASRSAKKGAL